MEPYPARDISVHHLGIAPHVRTLWRAVSYGAGQGGSINHDKHVFDQLTQRP